MHLTTNPHKMPTRYIHRNLEKVLKKAIKTFPAIVVTGPRQAGKTTMLKNILEKTHRFLSLEQIEVRQKAREDPIGFFENNQPPLILDEIQYIPELLSYIKTRIDENRKPGQWILAGSQQFSLMKGVSESLAGRVAVLTLLPFSYYEKKRSIPKNGHYTRRELFHWMLRGGYPELTLNDKVDRELWASFYLSTYLERDVRNLGNIGDLKLFQFFLKLCAIRTAQLLNASEVARELGVSSVTVKKWLSILEASHQIYLLPPYFENLGKRLVKTPKLYFLDTALATELLGIHTETELVNSPHYGALFETMIVNEAIKFFMSAGKRAPLSFLRTHDGLEIDLIIEGANQVQPIEIKSAMTITPHHFSGLLKGIKLFKKQVKHPLLVSATQTIDGIYKGISEQNWKTFLKEV